MAFRITVNQETCIGCGACENVCENFKLEDGKARPVNETVPDKGCNEEAKDSCPVQAISVEEA